MDTNIRLKTPQEKEAYREQYRKAIMPAASTMRIDRPQEEIKQQEADIKAGVIPF